MNQKVIGFCTAALVVAGASAWYANRLPFGLRKPLREAFLYETKDPIRALKAYELADKELEGLPHSWTWLNVKRKYAQHLERIGLKDRAIEQQLAMQKAFAQHGQYPHAVEVGLEACRLWRERQDKKNVIWMCSWIFEHLGTLTKEERTHVLNDIGWLLTWAGNFEQAKSIFHLGLISSLESKQATFQQGIDFCNKELSDNA